MIKTTHHNCNGWAIYGSDYIEGDQPHNIHIADAEVEVVDGKVKSVRANSARETRCGKLRLTKDRKYEFASVSENAIRTRVAEMQNSGCELCGQCVATFYTDGQ